MSQYEIGGLAFALLKATNGGRAGVDVSDDDRDDAAVVGMPTMPLKAAIVADLRAGMTQTEAAIRHGVNRASVSRLARRWCSDVVFVRGRRRAA